MTDIYAFGENWAIPAPLRTKLDTVVSDWLAANPQSDPSLPGRVSTLETQTTQNAAAITTKAPTSHTHTITDVTGLDKVTQAVNPKTVVVTPERFGVDPTGVNDSTSGIRAAVAATPDGGTLHLPLGEYGAPKVTPAGESDYIVLTKPITITGDPGTILRDIRFYVKGTLEPFINLGASANEGDNTVTTATAHGYAVGDYVQVLSQYNVYTTDAGVYQMGSTNPTNGTTPECRASEIHKVSSVPSTTSVKFLDLLNYGGYTTTAPATPMTGVSSAQIRKISVARDVTFRGLTFQNTSTNYRCILARATAGLTIDGCRFLSNDNTGFAVRVFDSYNVRLLNTQFEKNLKSFSGSSWNDVIIGGGCTEVTISRCTFTGGAQAVDISPNAASSSAADPGGVGTEYRTTQRVRVLGCGFIKCSDGATTHPATMDVLISGCQVSGGSTGFRVRSPRTHVTGNLISTTLRGIELSAFCDNTVITGNSFMQLPGAEYSGYYAGVTYTPSSSEIVNNNRVRLDIVANAFLSTGTSYMFTSGTSTGTYSGPMMTDEWKARKSRVVIANNISHGGSILITPALNGTRIIGNTFEGATGTADYVRVQGTASVIHNNNFDDFTLHVRTDAQPYQITYSYSTQHVIGANATTSDTLKYNLTNARTMVSKVGV